MSDVSLLLKENGIEVTENDLKKFAEAYNNKNDTEIDFDELDKIFAGKKLCIGSGKINNAVPYYDDVKCTFFGQKANDNFYENVENYFCFKNDIHKNVNIIK